jgi:hypothetical protein
MKLSDWAKKQGIAYLTAYRWFKDKKLPVHAYQSESGTIIVQDDEETLSEQQMAGSNSNNNDVMSLFLKKTVEFSKNNATIEDFAAYILSNFTLKINYGPESPKYSKNKPKAEDVQRHFQQFLKPNAEKPKPKMFIAEPEALDELLSEPELVDDSIETVSVDPAHIYQYSTESKTSAKLYNDLSSALNSENVYTSTVGLGGNPVRIYGSTGSEGAVVRSVETPQNYTGSTIPSFSSSAYSSLNPNAQSLAYSAVSNSAVNTSGSIQNQMLSGSHLSLNAQFPAGATGGFVPTQKELESAKVLENVDSPVKARRGRKSKQSRTNNE